MTGLLAHGSSYSPRLPESAPPQGARSSGMVRVSSPLTVAGPRRNFTGLPLVVRTAVVVGQARPAGRTGAMIRCDDERVNVRGERTRQAAPLPRSRLSLQGSIPSIQRQALSKPRVPPNAGEQSPNSRWFSICPRHIRLYGQIPKIPDDKRTCRRNCARRFNHTPSKSRYQAH